MVDLEGGFFSFSATATCVHDIEKVNNNKNFPCITTFVTDKKGLFDDENKENLQLNGSFWKRDCGLDFFTRQILLI